MIKKNKLGLAFAVVAALGLGSAAQTTQAANIATNGVGEVVYIPYYTTTDGKVTFVRLTNNSFNTLAVKFKIREGQFSSDVRDFHLFLSPRDVWSASIGSDANGVFLNTSDTSCTAPAKNRGQWISQGGTSYNMPVPANGSTGSTEGYLVAHVMGTSDGRAATAGDLFDSVAQMKHGSAGTPPDNGTSPETLGTNPNAGCFAVSAAFDLETSAGLAPVNPQRIASLRSQFTEPTNALSGAAAIVNPATGAITEIPVTVVANLINTFGVNSDGLGGYAETSDTDFSNDQIGLVGSVFPDSTSALPSIISVYDDVADTLVTLDTLSTSNMVSAALMHSSLSNYIDTTGGNSWVVTFPTKRTHDNGTNLCSAPFPVDCAPDITTIQHTVSSLGATTYVTNEEESTFFLPGTNQICESGVDFSSNCPTTVEGLVSLPTEVNVVTMGDNHRNGLASGLVTNVPGEFLNGITTGWMQMRFTDAQALTGEVINTTDVKTLNGLPAIGFSYTEYVTAGGITETMTQPYTFTSPFNP